MKYFKWILALGLLLPLASYAGPAIERLHQFFDETGTLQADFQQTISDDKANTVQEASGTLILRRPGKFRWTYVKPYKQLIVADGKKIWIYDEDLEQVTVKPLDATLGSTPVALLSGSGLPEDNFKVTEIDPKDGLDWLELIPKAKDSSFESIRLGFGAHDLEVMELVDAFGQTTRLRFTNLQHDPEVNPNQFTFTPPPGADVIGQ